jgi:hypothetical protein
MKNVLICLGIAILLVLGIGAWQNNNDLVSRLERECVRNDMTGTEYTEFKCNKRSFFIQTVDVDKL